MASRERNEMANETPEMRQEREAFTDEGRTFEERQGAWERYQAMRREQPFTPAPPTFRAGFERRQS